MVFHWWDHSLNVKEKEVHSRLKDSFPSQMFDFWVGDSFSHSVQCRTTASANMEIVDDKSLHSRSQLLLWWSWFSICTQFSLFVGNVALANGSRLHHYRQPCAQLLATEEFSWSCSLYTNKKHLGKVLFSWVKQRWPGFVFSIICMFEKWMTRNSWTRTLSACVHHIHVHRRERLAQTRVLTAMTRVFTDGKWLVLLEKVCNLCICYLFLTNVCIQLCF